MVKVREEQPLDVDGRIDLELWLCQINENYPSLNLARIREVCDLSEQAEAKAISTNTVWNAGRSSFRTGLDMAVILMDLRIDEDGIVAAIIYRAVRENQITLNHVKKQFGASVAALVEGVLKMAAISNIQFSKSEVLGEQKDQLEQAKRLLISIVDDVRVALIKLAERTCAIRAIASAEPSKRIRLAREVFEIYSPLAHRLGIGHLKWELEDMSFRYLEPLAYKRIASLLAEKRRDRQDYIEQVIETLKLKLKEVHVEAQIDGRAKHIYSIWRKMQNKGISFSQVYDVRAVRVLVPDINDCYRALGIVHGCWRNLPHEFDDYIASPKENGYRSLHTAVIGPEGNVLEVQIRTFEMHEEAEYGVCSHWQYKSIENDPEPEAYQQRIDWLRTLLDWEEELGDVTGISKDLLAEVSLDRVYLFTREGQVIDMMPKATPVDFAYRVHTEVGHKCSGAKVNGKVVPLNTVLKSGDQVEIIVGDKQEPRREWLHEHLGYVATSRAKAKIQSWFGQRTKRKNSAEGEKLLIEELRHLGFENADLNTLVKSLGYKKPEDLYAQIGVGEVSVLKIVEKAVSLVELDQRDRQLSLLPREAQPLDQELSLINGLGQLEHEISTCCKAAPGDSIVGIIDDANKVCVHRQDCLKALQANLAGRIIRLDWRHDTALTFPVNIEIFSYDRPGLLHDVTGVLMLERTNVISMSSGRRNNRVNIAMEIEVTSINGLLQTLEKIETLSNIISAQRVVSE
jgi:GTP pyrophosphokinase